MRVIPLTTLIVPALTYEFHSYDNTGHAFFSVDSDRYRPEAAVDGWNQIFKWFEKFLY